MDMLPFERRQWALGHQQQLIREGQASWAVQRRARQQLGQALHWLGNQFIDWDQQLQRREQLRPCL